MAKRERDEEGRVVACRHGHPYVQGSFKIGNRGSRICMICDAARPYRQPVRNGSALEQYMKTFRFELHVEALGECWIPGTSPSDVYRTKGGMAAHRWVWIEVFGSIDPPWLVLDHVCEIKGCVRPSHLDPVTSYENVDRYLRGR